MLTEEDIKPYGKLLDGVPDVRLPFGDEAMWTVLGEYRFVTRDGWLVTVHENEKTDLASLPKATRLFLGADGKESTAAVFHDHVFKHQYRYRENGYYCVENHHLTWSECNMIMHDIMILAGTGFFRRNAIMGGLWAGSWVVWLKYRYSMKNKERG